jgi:rhodanese-related sulfurtransferase
MTLRSLACRTARGAYPRAPARVSWPGWRSWKVELESDRGVSRGAVGKLGVGLSMTIDNRRWRWCYPAETRRAARAVASQRLRACANTKALAGGVEAWQRAGYRALVRPA